MDVESVIGQLRSARAAMTETGKPAAVVQVAQVVVDALRAASADPTLASAATSTTMDILCNLITDHNFDAGAAVDAIESLSLVIQAASFRFCTAFETCLASNKRRFDGFMKSLVYSISEMSTHQPQRMALSQVARTLVRLCVEHKEYCEIPADVHHQLLNGKLSQGLDFRVD